MATFDGTTDTMSVSERQHYTQYPLRRLERSVQGFLKVIQIDLSRLHRHRLNMEKFERLQDWSGLHTEQVNASRTVRQVTGNIREIERVRLQVAEEDVDQFDDRIKDMKQAALRSVAEFIDVSHGGCMDGSSPDNELQPLTLEPASSSNDGKLSTVQGQLLLKDLPENSVVSESWDDLLENLESLNGMIHHFATTVQSQQEGLDRIEDNIDTTHAAVQKGSGHLATATKYKAALLPIAGAVIGTVVAGPVGLVAGAKIGGVLAAVGGSAVGFLSGRFLKKRQEKTADMELAQLSQRSNSLPNINTDEGSSLTLSRQRNQSERQMDAVD